MSPRARQFNKRIAFEQPVKARSDTGQLEMVYIPVTTRWARIRTLSGNERIASQQVGAMLTHEITIRYDSALAIKPTWRIAYNDPVLGERIFDIKDARNLDEGNVEIRMRCVEVVT